MQENQRDEDGGGGHRGGGSVGAPGNRYGCRDERDEQRQRERVVAGREHEQHRGEQIGGKRARRDEVDFARRGIRPEQEARDDQQDREDEASGDVEGVRAKRLKIADAGQRPEHACRHRGDGEPAPEPRPGETEGGGGDNGEIEIERPIIGLLGRDDERREEGADQAEAGQSGSMHERCGKRAERDEAEQHEGGGRTDKAVKRVGRISIGIGDRRAGGGEHARDVGLGEPHGAGVDLAAPRPFARGDQSKSDNSGKHHARAGPEPALLDRIADEEEATERERDAAGPDDPLRAKALLEADLFRRGLLRG